ncbi:diguanylate cyclase domain-containing protein [Rhodoferax sp. U11-2br]|uniref:diguanylate cyclase domain-containing protein n=1 Tax=Rhodoferax sp. U11-2br TaxID=2838878 RepID=UPI001BEBA538|nr:diguanylate cyclase [Rhodoferax sp. U11-2br]MBT3067862.1 diguanylate cyclase [Rhodoferax sp. U11-2br]
MGLRRRISVYLISVLAVLALLTLSVLRWHGHQRAFQLEVAEAHGELKRLIGLFHASTFRLSGTLQPWANWTGLHDYMLDRQPAFRQKELDLKVLTAAQVDFLVLLDMDSQLIDMIEVRGRQGDTPATDTLRTQSQAYPALAKSSANSRGCGVIRVGQQVAQVCVSPVFKNGGEGSPSGFAVMGQWVNDALTQQISQLSGARFSVVDLPGPALTAPSQYLGEPVFRKDAVTLIEHERVLELRYPIANIFGQQIAEIRMEWPRLHEQMADVSLHATQAVVVGLMVVCGVVLALLLDLVVVRRLKLLQEELAGIVDSKRWAGAVSVRGEDELAELARYTQEVVAVVRHQVHELKNLSLTDTLTGLANRRAFNERLDHILAQYARQQLSAALILMDVDHFKKYNDTYGHPAGDEALKAIARCLRTALRRELDMPARLGGEEFGVLLQGVTAEQACAAAEHIRLALQNMALAHEANPPLKVMTMSLGVTVVTDADTATTLYHRADAALYQAKHEGRNRVTLV